MAILVARMVKMKAGNLHGMQRHNQRETEAHSNKEIDNEKSYLNYDLINQKSINYKDKIHEIIHKQRVSEKAIRKDAVLCDEWIITSQKNFFDGMYPEDIEDFFKVTCDYFKERCGSQNMVYATVHMDETTPHMHLGIVPMVDGRLSSKEVFSRAHLLEIQNELPQYLQSRGFENIYRGQEESKRKHLSVPEYKEVQNKTAQLKKEYDKGIENLRELSTMNTKIDDDILRKIQQYSYLDKNINLFDKKYEYSDWAQENILSVAKEKIGFDKKKKYIFSEEDIEQICKKVNDLNHSSQSNNEFKKANNELMNENRKLYSSIPKLIKKETNKLLNNTQKLEEENEVLKMVFNNASETKNKVIDDCKRIIFDTELYLEKYLKMSKDNVQAYKGYLSVDNKINIPQFYKLDEVDRQGVFDEIIDIYNTVGLNKKLESEENLEYDNDLNDEDSNLVDDGYYKAVDDFELEL